MNACEINERMAGLRSKRVGHRIARETRSRLFNQLLTAEREGVIALIGPAGVGKTGVIERVYQLLIEHYHDQMLADPGFLPILSVTAVTGLNGDFSWKDGFTRMLVAGKEPLVGKKTIFPVLHLDGQMIASMRGLVKDEFRRVFESMAKNRRLRIIFMDEGSAIIDESVNRYPVRQFNILKSLAVELGIVIVLIGAYDLIGLRDGNGQLIRRADWIHMPRYQLDQLEEKTADTYTVDEKACPDYAEFSAAVDTLASAGPVEISPDALVDKRFLLMKSVGCVGIFRDWFARSCVDALMNSGGVLTREIIERNALPISTLGKLVREAEMGEKSIADSPESELAALYGVSSLRSVETNTISAVVAPSSRGRRVGQRGPSRDAVGRANA